MMPGARNNINRNFFYDEGETTRWALDTEFKFSGLMRIMAILHGRRPLPKADAQQHGSLQSVRRKPHELTAIKQLPGHAGMPQVLGGVIQRMQQRPAAAAFTVFALEMVADTLVQIAD